ncbi:MAG: CTP synthase [Lentisphaeria bacterium]|nr:CTP synthase [Lentisphaeria bacterium]
MVRVKRKHVTKHIFITGGVVSSLGKGITAASLALLLKRRGYRVKMQKLDPYLNVDPGTMNPYEHGEVYVTDDGAETDLDLGHYERFSGIPCSQASNYTSGGIFLDVLNRERRGDYLGKTVQVIPHITNEIKAAISSLSGPDVDIAITEIGGTAGDIESLPFLEAIRQYRQEIGRENGLFMHLTLLPYISAAGEMKTKPSQQSVGILRGIGIFPDMLVCRCERPMEDEHRDKLAMYCNVPRELVFEECDVENTIYEVPLELAKQDLDIYTLELLGLHVRTLELTDWKQMVDTYVEPVNGEVEIAVVGKYMSLNDAYKSIYESLTHAGIGNSVGVKVRRIEAQDLEKDGDCKQLEGVDGVLVPGGFGQRGVEGKICAIQWARENNVPFFGICLGMQSAVIEIARNVCGFKDGNSHEFDPDSQHKVVHLMADQHDVTDMGGTMRLGAYPCVLEKGSKAADAYGAKKISERHRHRFEVNNEFRDALSAKGVVFSGVSPDGHLVEIMEFADHPWFVACQFHPEFKSTPLKAHPLFKDFVNASMNIKINKEE